jgi:hypothetical protein
VEGSGGDGRRRQSTLPVMPSMNRIFVPGFNAQLWTWKGKVVCYATVDQQMLSGSD